MICKQLLRLNEYGRTLTSDLGCDLLSDLVTALEALVSTELFLKLVKQSLRYLMLQVDHAGDGGDQAKNEAEGSFRIAATRRRAWRRVVVCIQTQSPRQYQGNSLDGEGAGFGGQNRRLNLR